MALFKNSIVQSLNKTVIIIALLVGCGGDVNTVVQETQMGVLDTGWISPGTVTEQAIGPYQIAWDNPTNIISSDNTYATNIVAHGGLSKLLKGTGLGLSVPAEALIVGIEIKVEGYKVADNSVWLGVGPVKAGSPGTYVKTSTLPSSDGTVTKGSGTDLWYDSWTPSDVNSSGFGAYIAVEPDDTIAISYIDNIQVKVYYTLDRTISDSGTGTETLVLSNSVVATDTGTGLDELSGDRNVILEDTAQGYDLVGGSPEVLDIALATEIISINRTIPAEDGLVGVDEVLVMYKISIEDTISILEELLVSNNVTVEESGVGSDSSDIDYQFSSVVMRFTAQAATIKFTGYKEEVV